MSSVAREGWVGKSIAGRFTVERPLTKERAGRVFLATQVLASTTRPVALEILRPDPAFDHELVPRFLQECEAMSLIEHPNVARIYDFGRTERGALYVAAELVNGKSLATVIDDEGALDSERALDRFAQICRGVARLHDRGIVHRGLGAASLMLVRDGAEPELVKLIDFGLGQTLVPSARGGGALSRAGTVSGRPPYMSPEQFMGGDVDVRTDVYALGVLAYELLTGMLPFDGDDLNDWAIQHVTAAPRRFDATPTGARVPKWQRDAILRALSKDPAERPPSARALLREVSEPRQRAVVSTPPPPSIRPVPLLPRQPVRSAAQVGTARTRWTSPTWSSVGAIVGAAIGALIVFVVTTSLMRFAPSRATTRVAKPVGAAPALPVTAAAPSNESTGPDAARAPLEPPRLQ
jgi:serine/threonine-protein kinase